MKRLTLTIVFPASETFREIRNLPMIDTVG
jgi:hypothetical protein